MRETHGSVIWPARAILQGKKEANTGSTVGRSYDISLQRGKLETTGERAFLACTGAKKASDSMTIGSLRWGEMRQAKVWGSKEFC
jgi:hypothetical protein